MRPAVLLALVLALTACGGDEASAPTTTIEGGSEPTTESQPTTLEPATTTEAEPAGPAVVLGPAGGGEVLVPVEVADSQDEREVGLMNRESLPEGSGMIFLFDEDVSGGFWMKDTLIPLSIAFADGSGTIVRIFDMEPCEADPSDIYEPGVFYRSALEVNQGAFERWGVSEGDRLTLRE
jgi:uncharacterized membrane protein (UPF0127 family)